MGRQVSWITVFFVEYAGPIIVAAIILALRLLWQAPEKPLLFNQKLLISLIFAHYIKREVETAFVHRFSNETMPISSIFINCTHYWVLMGLSTYWLLRPNYTAPTWLPDWGCVVFACLMVFFEFMNGACHIV
jgi:very-long-chain enoyl-CoA reductase